jgi:riboflavin biosynthesis pyrimidine reductase
VRQVYPADSGTGPDDAIDPVAYIAAEDRPAAPDRPWIVVNMIASVDGATRVDGKSGGLGGPPDAAMFHALRAVADFILVGASTVDAETYHPPTASPEVQRARTARGQASLPRLAIVTARLGLSPAAPVFSSPDAATRPVIVTTDDAPPDRVQALSTVADIMTAGSGTVDLGRAVRALRQVGGHCVLCEGGPTLNASLIDGIGVDELCLTLAPLVLGGDPSPIVKHAQSSLRRVRLARIAEADGLLFLRYLFS